MPLGAFEALIEQMRVEHPEIAIPAPADPADLQQKAPCPKCHQRMDTHYYFGGGHAVMSTCERCELHWLNGGVLMRIVQAPRDDRGGDRRTEREGHASTVRNKSLQESKLGRLRSLSRGRTCQDFPQKTVSREDKLTRIPISYLDCSL